MNWSALAYGSQPAPQRKTKSGGAYKPRATLTPQQLARARAVDAAKYLRYRDKILARKARWYRERATTEKAA